MPDETTTTNPAPTEPVDVSTPEPTIVAQEPSVPVPTDTEPVEMPVEPIIAPAVDPTTSEVTNTATPADPVPGQNPAEIVATEDTVVSLEPVKNEKVTPHQNLEIPNLGEPDVAEGYVEARPAIEIPVPIEQNTAHTTPQQNLEIPNLVIESPTPLSESELLAAEIAQRKLLKSSNRFMAWLRAKALVTRQRLIRKKLDKIMALFNQHEKITNELIGKNLHIPHRTVSRYLDTLEKEGKIKQVGAGRNIFYVKV